jgi:hypothetical protein
MMPMMQPILAQTQSFPSLLESHVFLFFAHKNIGILEENEASIAFEFPGNS